MMKNLIIVCLLMFTAFAQAQDKPIKVVFDITSADPGTHASTVRHVKMMSKAYPESKFEIVGYSSSMDMFLADKSSVREDMESLVENDNVAIKVCEGTMKRYKVEKGQLIKGVETVPDGIMEIISKQQDGWGYIKEAHQ